MNETSQIPRQQLEREVEDRQLDLEAKDDLIRTLKRKLTHVQRELNKLTEGTVVDEGAERVFAAWVRATGKDSAKVVFGDKRQQTVKARFRDGYTAEQLIQAVNAVGSHPYVVNSKRSVKGPKDQRYDDLELICRSEVHVDRNLALAERIEDENRQAWDRAVDSTIKRNGRNLDDDRKPLLYGDAFRTFVGALDRAGIDVPNSPPSGQYQTRCPAHDDRSPSLRWTEAGDGRILLDCKAGCETADVLAALDLDFPDIGPSSWPSVEQRRVVSERRSEAA